MRLSVYFLPLLVVLTACSSTTKQPIAFPSQSTTHSTSQPDQPKQSPPVTIAPTNTQATGADRPDQVSTEKAPISITKPIAAIVEPVDIWQRMRQGYRLPNMDSKLVAHYENWNREHSNYVQKMLRRGDKYLFHIVEQIEKRDMPMEIALLPAIESAYKAKARSRSNASGLWQFIPATGRYLGMRQDWWSDQRRDILISTEAALDYLQSLHTEFGGDWLLALAAYNGGKGTIGKAMRRNKRNNKPTNLESLDLRQETTRYVPKLIALSNVIMNPHLYGIKLPNIANTPYFAVQKIPGQTDLIRLVKNTDLSRKDLDDLNPSFLRWASDPKGPHRIVVPLARQTSVANYLETAPDLGKLNWREHRIRKGETMGKIAEKYAVKTAAIRSINSMKNNKIRAGKTILIPLEARPNNAQYAKRTKKSTVKRKASHQVRKGDTLWQIARRYDLSVSDLVMWNNISKSHTLALNQIIKLSRY